MSIDNLQPELQAEALRWLACPACHQALVPEARLMEAGLVRCTACARRYPIVDSIPVLLTVRAV